MSFSPETDELVNELIQAEYKNACEKFGEKYKDEKEAWEVLKEEVLEVIAEFNQVGKRAEWIDEIFEAESKAKDVDTVVRIYLRDMWQPMINTMKELAQVGAVLQKIKNTIDKEK